MGKKRFILPLVLITLIYSVGFTTISLASSDNSDISIELINNDISLPKIASTIRPIFEGADENASVVLQRTQSNYTGAILKADLYENITIWYSYVGGNNESAPLLFGDEGISTPNSLNWTQGALMHYDEEETIARGGGVSAFYNYTFNISSEFIMFRARYGEYEDDIGIPNIITTSVWINSSFIQEFYTQYGDIDLDIKMRKYNITNYGLMYRVISFGPTDDPDFTEPFQNVTIPYIADYITDGVSNIILNGSFTHNFPVDAIVEVRAFITHYDNITKESRIIHENQAHLVALVDGTPLLELSAERYTNLLNVSIFWNATIITTEANITSLEIDWDDATGIETLNNLSIHTVYHLYSNPGEYNISVTAFAYSANASLFRLILIDQETPSGDVLIKLDENTLIDPDLTELNEIESGVKRVSFLVNATDGGGSGVMKIILASDEGNSVELQDDGEITLQFLEYGTHEISLTVIDNAGNEFSLSFLIQLKQKPDPTMGPVPYPFGVISIISLLSLIIILKCRKR